jgi:hypothetical protein
MNTIGHVIDFTGQPIRYPIPKGWADYHVVGLDLGTGIITVRGQAVQARGKKREYGPEYQLSTSSFHEVREDFIHHIAEKRNAKRNNPASCLMPGEYIVKLDLDEENHDEHLCGALALTHGKHPNDYEGVEERYYNEYTRAMVLALLGTLIQETTMEVRLFMCLPYSSFKDAVKDKVIANLEGTHEFQVNDQYKTLTVKIGEVYPEGLAPIRTYANETGNYVSMDPGDRTFDVTFSNGFLLNAEHSFSQPYGVREVITNVQDVFLNRHGRQLSILDTRALLNGYTSGDLLPPIGVDNDGNGQPGELEDGVQRAIIQRAVRPYTRSVLELMQTKLSKISQSYAVGASSRDSKSITSFINKVVLYGGGSYLLRDAFKQGLAGVRGLEKPLFPNLIIPPFPEYLNAEFLFKQVRDTDAEEDPSYWA